MYLFVFAILFICFWLSSGSENVLHSFVPSNSRPKRAAFGSLADNILSYPDCNVLRAHCRNEHDDPFQLVLLSCIQNFNNEQTKNVPEGCQNVVWSHLSRFMNVSYVKELTKLQCNQESFYSECEKRVPNDVYVSCMLQNKLSVKSPRCQLLLQNLEVIIFSDYRLLTGFMKNCQPDVDKFSCGRLSGDGGASQTETLSCLQMHINQLDIQCKQEILHLSELQGENIKLDRLLYSSCKVEKIRFCPEMSPGSGLVFKCLLLHKHESGMSKQCQDHLSRRQKLISQDYKVSKGLARACKEDIRTYHCRKGVSDDKDVRLAQILMCLENVLKNNTKISPDCQGEMTDHRKMLMEDYQLSPELMRDCADDLLLCTPLEIEGKTIHCLMEHARPKRMKDKHISVVCQRALERLIKETDAGEDWRIDPVLRNACKPVVDAACKELVGGEGRVMSCLMEKIGTVMMTEQCETALIQIQYFIARDYKLDPQLYRACKEDAYHYCHAKRNWVDMAGDMDPERGPLVLPCLYKYAYNPQDNVHLSPICVQEVRRVMRQRAISVDLLPEIEDLCIDDLANLCFDKTAKGEEIDCLQYNLLSLNEKCRLAVSNFTEAQSGHIELNPVLLKYCRGVMEKHCAAILQTGKDEGDMMECLISHKNDPDVKANVKCRAAIEHYQIISLKNYRFTRKFKDACRSYVVRFCPKARFKIEVVRCLSEIVRNDTILGNRHSIPKDCRQQLKNQLFQQRENINFDPYLKEACRQDLLKHCSKVEHGSSLSLECLQNIREKLTDSCQRALFVVKNDEFNDNSLDYNLITTCNDMIEQFCHNTDPTKVLDCLKIHRNEATFDEKCKLVVVHRMIEQNSDYRFNPKLQMACKQDIKKFCAPVIATEPQDKELQGKVVGCLKEQFRYSKLSGTCENQLAALLKEQALNYRLDPLLSTLCKAEIQTICKSTDNADESGDGMVEECLKNALLNRKIVSVECAQEVAGLIEEAKVDIGADPLLQRACALDLLKYCRQLEQGAGRHLKCLQIILNDDTRELEAKCKKELSSRMEMYKFTAEFRAVKNLGDIYDQVSSSPAKKYFLVIGLSFIGLIFIFGLFCGRISRRHTYMKTK